MAETTTVETTDVISQYSAQVASDLERNAKEQERLSGEIQALQAQLTALQHNHTVLLSIQQTLAAPGGPAESAQEPAATVPAPRKKATRKPRQRAEKAAATKPSARAKKQSAKKTAPTPPKPTRVTLAELVRHQLNEQREPRSAAEIATALGQAHPDRGIKTTVVRTTLENLVAKSQAHRAKQGSSVFYTAPSSPEPAAAPGDEPHLSPGRGA
jgi:hypothetical protein